MKRPQLIHESINTIRRSTHLNGHAILCYAGDSIQGMNLKDLSTCFLLCSRTKQFRRMVNIAWISSRGAVSSPVWEAVQLDVHACLGSFRAMPRDTSNGRRRTGRWCLSQLRFRLSSPPVVTFAALRPPSARDLRATSGPSPPPTDSASIGSFTKVWTGR